VVTINGTTTHNGTVSSSVGFAVSSTAGITLNCPNGAYYSSSSIVGGIVTAATCAPMFDQFPMMSIPINAGAMTTLAVNKQTAYGFTLPYALMANYISFQTNTADASTTDLYDIGLSNSSGTLICDTGPTSSFSAATGLKNVVCSPQTLLMPGNYFLTYTGASTTWKMGSAGSGGGYQLRFTNNATTTTGGQLLNFTPPATSTFTNNIAPAFWIHQ